MGLMSDPAVIAPAARPQPHSRLRRRLIARGLVKLCRAEALLFLREPAAVFFTLAFPQLLLLFVGVVYGDRKLQGVRYIDLYLPTLMGAVAANLGAMGIAINIADARAKGILRRYKLVPLPFWCYFASQVTVGVLMYALSIGGLALSAAIVYGLHLRGSLLLFFAVLLLGMCTMFALGFFLGGLNVTVRTTQLAGTALFFFMFFGSGSAIPRAEFPPWLRAVTALNPLTQLADSLVRVYLGSSLHPRIPGLIGLAVLALVLAVAARRIFRWEVS